MNNYSFGDRFAPSRSDWVIMGSKQNWIYQQHTQTEVETELKNLARSSPEETFVLYQLNRICSAKVTTEPKLVY